MPYYRITITLKDLSVHTGIRKLENNDIDSAWEIFQSSAVNHYGEGAMEDYQCVMLSKYDPDVQASMRKNDAGKAANKRSRKK